MIIDNIRLVMLVLLLVILQFMLNNITNLYLDLVGILLVVCLMNGALTVLHLVIIALVADLFGYWYIGEHLVAIMCLSCIFSSRMHHFFKISNFLLKMLLIQVAFCSMSFIIYVLNKIFNNHSHLFITYAIQLIIFIPIIQIVYEKFIPIKSRDLIWYD